MGFFTGIISQGAKEQWSFVLSMPWPVPANKTISIAPLLPVNNLPLVNS
jgi:hypothetical protein